MTNTQLQLADLYLDYINNYLTVKVFAEHPGITEELALLMLKEGREYHELRASIKAGK
jgi:hypothetical protein